MLKPKARTNGIDPDPTFQLVSDHTLMSSNILDINFTFVFPSCKFVKLHIMIAYHDKIQYKLFVNFYKKGISILKLSIFDEKLSHFISFSEQIPFNPHHWAEPASCFRL
jgi:hypothetical protein